MQKNLLLICAVAGSLFVGVGSRARAVIAGQVDTFQDTTLDNWGGGASPTNIASGGPAGASDRFLQISSSGSGGGGGKLITFNRTQWLGNYGAAGVGSISMDLDNLSTSPLSIRIAFKDGTGSGAAGYSSDAFVLPAGSGWTHEVYPLTSATFTAINSPSETFAALLAGPAEFRILSATSPALDGDAVTGPLGVDNITAVATAVPEPASLSAMLVGSGLMLGRRRRK